MSTIKMQTGQSIKRGAYRCARSGCRDDERSAYSGRLPAPPPHQQAAECEYQTGKSRAHQGTGNRHCWDALRKQIARRLLLRRVPPEVDLEMRQGKIWHTRELDIKDHMIRQRQWSAGRVETMIPAAGPVASDRAAIAEPSAQIDKTCQARTSDRPDIVERKCLDVIDVRPIARAIERIVDCEPQMPTAKILGDERDILEGQHVG